MTHTPTPWQLGHIMTTTKGRIWRDIYIPGGHIARVNLDSGNGQKTQEANAAHIVRCVNSHDALVAALREACDLIDMLGRECSDRVYNGQRGNPVTANKFRAALAALDKAEPPPAR